ncbi:MAG: DHA2 family efflux MFS transporter permease subunit, partial [Rhodanobacteraceae bacterium]
PIDVTGILLLVIGVGCLQFMLDNGNDKDWFASPMIVALGMAAVISLAFLIVWELTDQHPVVDLSLFRKPNFRYGTIALSLGFFAFFGINVVYPLWLQVVLGYTATWAGLATAPVGIIALVLMPFIGANMRRLNLRALTTFAFLVFAFTSFWFSHFTTDASFGQLVMPRLVQGFGVACFFVPLNQILLSGLKPGEVANASGLSNFFRTIAGSISTAVTVTLWQHRGDYHHAILAENVRAASPGTTHYLDLLSRMHVPALPGYAALDQILNRQALTLAVNDVFWLFGIVFVLIIGAIWLTRPPFTNIAAEGHA